LPVLSLTSTMVASIGISLTFASLTFVCFNHRLFAYLIFLFKFQAHPLCLVFLPFFICVRGGT
jgi:hypothetical protein